MGSGAFSVFIDRSRRPTPTLRPPPQAQLATTRTPTDKSRLSVRRSGGPHSGQAQSTLSDNSFDISVAFSSVSPCST